MMKHIMTVVAFVATTVAFLLPAQAAKEDKKLTAEDKKLTWVGCGISKKAFMAELAAAYEKKTGVVIELQGGGATKGIRSVSAQKVHMGGTCRHLIEDPETMATTPEERRVQLTPVAWDALVAIVHKSNPVDNISLNQVRALYTGKIKNWKELGGNDAPVELYVRKGKISGVGRTLRELVFNDYNQEFVGTHEVKSSGPLHKGVAENPNGIGITGISSARKLEAKILKLDGKDPSYENIKSGDYLLYRPLYLAIHLQNENKEVKNFREFVMGSEGQKIMRKVGTVPYGDAIPLWLKYLEQQKRALANGLTLTQVAPTK
jgi:phosphate transport system substrate-binding protein